ncbi:MAG: 4-amino-4-deoxy-L-arabinose transferase-like glycosyltransferase [Saprospiraceae bacterium]|jgi:4-amino-4-deoxy-L-arabinose transferase-like glycosyltransferase
MKVHKVKLLFILIFVVLISAFWKLGTHEVMRYDEARNGVNALEMLQNGDYINLHYAGKADTWNAKPPLFIWMQALSFKVFGKNTFALRFPAAFASLFIFFFLFKTIILYRKEYIAFAVCFILLTIQGIYGAHVARTGDFDALLTVFTTSGIYFFLKHIDFGEKRALYWSVISFGLAFMTKGPAFGILLPALLLYLIYRKQLLNILKSKILYKAIALLLFFPVRDLVTVKK